MAPVLYYDTKDVKKYNYSYVKKEEKNNEIDVYYRSYYDTTGIIIRYIKKGNEIDDIKLKYVDVMPYDVEPVEESSGTTIIAVSVVTFGIGLALVVAYAIKKIKSSRIM